HHATSAMVREYVTWYDRHFDAAWQDVLLMSPQAGEERIPLAFLVPTSSDDLRRMGKSYAATVFLSAGNITHTPAYGNLIALGILDAVQRLNPSPDHIATAAQYRDWIARTGRFLTFAGGGATIGYRLREDPNERASMRLIKETDAGIVVSGKIGMHTSVPFAEDVYIGAIAAVACAPHPVPFILPLTAPAPP